MKVTPASGAVEIKTDKAHYSAAKVILTAGPWIAKMLPPEFAAHFAVYRQTLCWFALKSNFERYTPERFPVFIWITGNRMQDMLYGFPAIDGLQRGLKVATERYESTVDPDAVQRDVSEESVGGMYSEYIAPRFPDVSSRCLRTATCLYTVTPTRSSSSITPTPPRTSCSPRRVPATASSIRPLWVRPSPNARWACPQHSISQLFGGTVLGRRAASHFTRTSSCRSCL